MGPPCGWNWCKGYKLFIITVYFHVYSYLFVIIFVLLCYILALHPIVILMSRFVNSLAPSFLGQEVSESELMAKFAETEQWVEDKSEQGVEATPMQSGT